MQVRRWFATIMRLLRRVSRRQLPPKGRDTQPEAGNINIGNKVPSYYEVVEANRFLLDLVEIEAVKSGDDWTVKFFSEDGPARAAAYRMAVYLPTDMRSYDPQSQIWRISLNGLLMMSPHWDEIAYLCGKAMDDLDPITDYRSKDRPQPSDSSPDDLSTEVADAFALLHLDPSAPAEVIQAVYRALSRRAHPDAGGNNETMKQLNLAYEIARQWAEEC